MNAPTASLAVPHQELRRLLPGLMLGLFMAALDQTIVAAALPTIARQLAGAELLAWVVSGYLLAMTVATPLFGKLSDQLGRRPMLAAALLLFVVASVLCALSRDLSELVAARLLQGIGAGGLMATTQALVGDLVEPAERGRYQGWFSSMFALASLAGPLLGGYLSTTLSWHWVFWLNLPLGVLTYLMARPALARLAQKRRDSRIDYLGAALLSVALASLLWLIGRVGHASDPLEARNLAALGLCVVTLPLFVASQKRAGDPLIPLPLLGIATARGGWMMLLFASFQAVGLAVLIPLHASGEGLAGSTAQLTAIAFGAPVGAYLGGRLSAHWGRYKRLLVTGSTLLPLALLAWAWLPLSAAGHLLVLLLCGAALGMQFPTSLVAVQSAVPAEHLGVATGLCGLARGLGGAVGVAVLSSLYWLLSPEAPSAALELAGGALASEAFRQLLMLDALVALAPLLVALRLEDLPLRR
ncbi:MDR family MFS transporter [Pseudomonas sp. BN411]|uniref:MDR family MFS transporter n=1 Tax=Pseudomonas sp. BN411 TaxID=2567887 RepID=UPI002458023E|nr:MDR family MFS transporter [Pseudomonas sp. BN411]MDH4559923.1 MFS transporter [Pseudomonas sp. BN411]